MFRCDRKMAIERRLRCDLRQPSAIWSRRGLRKSQLGVTGVLHDDVLVGAAAAGAAGRGVQLSAQLSLLLIIIMTMTVT